MAGIGKFLNNISALPEKAQAAVKAIQQAADRTGVDFAYLVQKANIESGMDSNAKARTSSATGLYQFVQNTWLDVVDRHGAEYGLQGAANAIQRDANGKPFVADKNARAEILNLRNNPQVAAVMAAELAAENTEALQAKVGGKIGATEMYLAHFLGAGGAGELLQAKNANPNAIAARLLPEAAAANHNVFYTEGGRARTVGEVYANFAKKFDGVDVASSSGVILSEVSAANEVERTPLSSAKGGPSTALRFAQDDKSEHLQILATITPETNLADASFSPRPVPQQLAYNDVPNSAALQSINGLIGDSAQFNAMMLAQQILQSAGHLTPKHDNKSA